MTTDRYVKPEIISHDPIRFETAQSGSSEITNGSFPGLGWGVDGTPSEERGEFPGGVFPGKGPKHDHRP